MAFEKMCVRSKPGWYVWAYVPYELKKKRKMVWRQKRVVAGPFASAKEAREAYPEVVKTGSLHGIQLTEHEVIKALADS